MALLARQSSSGYDLTQRMKRPIGFFWTAHQSHIYSELRRLEALGLIAHQMIEQSTRPDKKLFTITETGLSSLRNWVVAPLEPAPPRDELALKAYTIWIADSMKAVDLFRQQEERHAARLAEYEQMLASVVEENPGVSDITRPEFGNYATLHCGIMQERASVEWCHWMVEQFERRSE